MQNVLSSTRVPLLVTVETHSYAANVRFATLPRAIPIPNVVDVNPSRDVSLPHISSHNNDEVCRVAVILSPECIAGGMDTTTYIARHIMSYISCLISKLRGQKTGRATLIRFLEGAYDWKRENHLHMERSSDIVGQARYRTGRTVLRRHPCVSRYIFCIGSSWLSYCTSIHLDTVCTLR